MKFSLKGSKFKQMEFPHKESYIQIQNGIIFGSTSHTLNQ